jgi:nitrite reductase (NADH) small subunit
MDPRLGAEDQNGSWVTVASEAELPEGSAREFLLGSEVIALFRQSGEFYAVDGICAHQGGPIAKGMVDGKCVTCPWHGWQYDISTGENKLTKRKMLKTFPVRLRDGNIEVWLAGK